MNSKFFFQPVVIDGGGSGGGVTRDEMVAYVQTTVTPMQQQINTALIQSGQAKSDAAKSLAASDKNSSDIVLLSKKVDDIDNALTENNTINKANSALQLLQIVQDKGLSLTDKLNNQQTLSLLPATDTTIGGVKPDNDTTTVSATGVISSTGGSGGGITRAEAIAIADAEFDKKIIPTDDAILALKQDMANTQSSISVISDQLYLLQMKTVVIQDWLGINTTLLLGGEFGDITEDEIFDKIYTAIPSGGANLIIVFAASDVINFSIPFTKESFGAFGNLHDVAAYIELYCKSDEGYPLSMFLCSWSSAKKQFVMSTISNEIRIYAVSPDDNIMATAMLLTNKAPKANLVYIAPLVNNGTIYARVVSAQTIGTQAEIDAQTALLGNKATQKELDAVHVRLADVHKTFIDVDITTDVQNEFMGARTNVLRGASFTKSVTDQHDVVVYMDDAEVFGLLYNAMPTSGTVSCNIKFKLGSSTLTATQTWTKLQFSKLKTMQNVALDIQNTCRAFNKNLTSVTAWWKSGIEGACLAISTNWNGSVMLCSDEGDFAVNLQLTQLTNAHLLILGLNSDETEPNLYKLATKATKIITPASPNVHVVYDADRNATIAVDEDMGEDSNYPLYTWGGTVSNTSISDSIVTVSPDAVIYNPIYNDSLVFSITKINGNGTTPSSTNKTIYGLISYSANIIIGLASYQFGGAAQTLIKLQEAQQQSQSLNIYFTVNNSPSPVSVAVSDVTVQDVASFAAFALKITTSVIAYNPDLYKTFVCQYNPLLNKFSLSILNSTIRFPKVGGSGNPLHEASGLFRSNQDTIIINNIDCGVANTGLPNNAGYVWKYTYDSTDPNSLKNIQIKTGIVDFTADLSQLLNPIYWNLVDNNIAIFSFVPATAISAGSVGYLPNRICELFYPATGPFASTNELLDYQTWTPSNNAYTKYSYANVSSGGGTVLLKLQLKRFPQRFNKFTQYLAAVYSSTSAPVDNYIINIIVDSTDSQFSVNSNTYFEEFIKVNKADVKLNPKTQKYELYVIWLLNCNNNNILIESGVKSLNNTGETGLLQNISYNDGEIDLSMPLLENGMRKGALGSYFGDLISNFIDDTNNIYQQSTFELPYGRNIKVTLSGTLKFSNPLLNNTILRIGLINLQDWTSKIIEIQINESSDPDYDYLVAKPFGYDQSLALNIDTTVYTSNQLYRISGELVSLEDAIAVFDNLNLMIEAS